MSLATDKNLTHLAANGDARMVDVSAKQDTTRLACARGRVLMSRETLQLAMTHSAKKGDVFAVARVAGIMAAKKNQRPDPALSSASAHTYPCSNNARRSSAWRFS